MASILSLGYWLSLLSVTLVQIALGADNLIIITILADKLPPRERPKAVSIGLILAMVFRIMLLAVVAWLLRYMTTPFWIFDGTILGRLQLEGRLSGKAVILAGGGLFLIWKGVKELRLKAKGLEEEMPPAGRFAEVVAVIVGLNLLFSVDSILTVVGMTDRFSIMAGSVVISVGFMLLFVRPLSDFIARNPDFEILGLFVVLFIGFVLFLEGGHVAHITVNGSPFPYIPQWLVIFILLLMFSVDFYQNWLERKRETAPITLHRRKR